MTHPTERKADMTGSVLRYLKVCIRHGLHNLFSAFGVSCILAVWLTLSLHHVSWAHQVTLAWDPNTEPDLGGYIAYWGTSSRDYPYLTDVGNNTAHTITGLEEGQVYYFAITAYDSDYNESGYSAEVVYSVSPSDTGGTVNKEGGSGGGCFIATAAFGSPMANHVMILRQFRDKILLPNMLGRAAVVFYYKHSPPYADYIAAHDNLRRLIRWGLLPIVGLCWMVLKLGLWAAVAVLVSLQCFLALLPIALAKRKKPTYTTGQI